MELETTFEDVKIPEPLRGVMSLDELKRQRCFLDLTERQKLLVESFIVSGGDRTFAVQAAYHVANRESARALSYEMLSGTYVTDVLNTFWGRTPREILQQQVDRLCRKKKPTVAEVNALRLKCELAGFTPENMPRVNGYQPKPKQFEIGQIVLQDGTRFRVTRVDSEGKILAAEPVDAE